MFGARYPSHKTSMSRGTKRLTRPSKRSKLVVVSKMPRPGSPFALWPGWQLSKRPDPLSVLPNDFLF
jgi:hypothetical protein